MCKRAQSINEYALVITLVALAGLGMQSYIKRGIQGIVKTSADTLAGEKGDPIVYSGGVTGILPKAQWNPVAVAYESKISSGFFVAQTSGNQVYYNYYPDSSDLSNKIVIGGQDLTSGNFTSYDWEGYVDAIYDKNGNLIQKFTPDYARTNYAQYAILSSANKSMVQSGVIELGLVKFNQTNPLQFTADKKVTVDTVSNTDPMTTKTINNDTTHVTGAWTAVYELETANTFGAKDKAALNNNNNLNVNNTTTGLNK